MFPCQSKLRTVTAPSPARRRAPRTASWKCSESKSSGFPGAHRRRFTHVTGNPPRSVSGAESRGRYARASREKYAPVPWYGFSFATTISASPMLCLISWRQRIGTEPRRHTYPLQREKEPSRRREEEEEEDDDASPGAHEREPLVVPSSSPDRPRASLTAFGPDDASSPPPLRARSSLLEEEDPFPSSFTSPSSFFTAASSSSRSSRQTSCSISTSFPGAARSLSPRARYLVPGCAELLRPNTATLNSAPSASTSRLDSARPWSRTGHAPGMPSSFRGAARAAFQTHSRLGSSAASLACAKGRVTSNVSQ